VPYTQEVAHDSTWPGRDPEDITAWTLVQAGHVAGRRFTAALAEVGLTPTQFGALLVLDLEPGLSGGEVARRIAVTPQSVSELIATLAELGLIVRDPSPGRGHRIAASLTPAGQAALRAANTAVEEVDSLGLTEPEAALLNELLHKVLRAASGGRPAG
jgi:DNA-binding MarR family transcriptional regulator